MMRLLHTIIILCSIFAACIWINSRFDDIEKETKSIRNSLFYITQNFQNGKK